jgi:glycosyltransferase involved in cell wall biosynthesis
MDGYKCSIVIRSYNEEKHIGRLLTGVVEQSVKDTEIILVDSGSTDATLAIASRYPVKVLHIDPKEFTFGRSLNLGCAEAKGDFIVIASAHVYPLYQDWLEQLLLPFEDSDVAVVYGKHRGNRATRFSEHQVFASWFAEESVSRQDHPFCNNANAAIRRSLWLERPYDEKLPGLEDLEWASWAMSQGYSVAYSAQAEIIHVHEETYLMIYNRYRREAMALNRIRPDERFNVIDFIRLFLTNVFSDWVQASRERELRSEFWSIVRFRLAQFWGTYRGFSIPGPLTGSLKRTFYYPRGKVTSENSIRLDAAPIDYGGSGDSQTAEEVEEE